MYILCHFLLEVYNLLLDLVFIGITVKRLDLLIHKCRSNKTTREKAVNVKCRKEAGIIRIIKSIENDTNKMTTINSNKPINISNY